VHPVAGFPLDDGFSITKVLETPEFQEIDRIKAALLSGVPLGGPKFSGSWFG
jgi:hypothetical protein